jgi:hypothetical protein
MPGKKPVPARHPDDRAAAARELWTIVIICLTGYAIALVFALYSGQSDELLFLIAQANQW